jgi:hypothetical protein
MKFFIKTLLLAAFFLSIASIQSFAKDTLYVAALPPGNLNAVINADTTASGESAHVYVLNSDTTYFLTEEIRVKDLDLIGKITPDGYLPVIVPYINSDGTSPNNIAATPGGHSYILFKNLYLMGTRTDGSSVTSQCVSANGDSCRYIMEGCIFENFGATSTPNILNTWNSLGTDIFVTNCLFRNNQSDIPQNPGMNWAGPGINAIDTMEVTNSSFFVFGGNIEGSGSAMGYLLFNHNTIFMHTKSSPFSIGQMYNADITNNIFYSCYSLGLDSAHAYDTATYNANFFSPPAIVTLDSITGDLLLPPYNYTEDGRHVVITNNAYYWPKGIIDNFATMNADPDTSTGHYRNVGGKIIAPSWLETRPGDEAVLNDPGINISNNDSTDPGFDPTLVANAVDSMATYVRSVWKNGGSGAGVSNFVDLASPITPAQSGVGTYADVPANWKTTQGYPVKDNLRYTANLKGSDGLPLGDDTWWPDITGIQQLPSTVPTKFSLSQNYPNPFNPTTDIQYSITKSGFVTLKVYNMLGQEVATLVNQKQTAGTYRVDFNASKLASGVYLYRVESGDVSLTKKMILLK